jgi:hypothetical protein
MMPSMTSAKVSISLADNDTFTTIRIPSINPSGCLIGETMIPYLSRRCSVSLAMPMPTMPKVVTPQDSAGSRLEQNRTRGRGRALRDRSPGETPAAAGSCGQP